MKIDILKSSFGSLSSELIFTCPVCGRTFRHNDYQFPARWEDAIRKHLIEAHGGKRIGWDIIELPDDEQSSSPFFQEGGTASPPSQSHDDPSHPVLSEPPVRNPSLGTGEGQPSPSVLKGVEER